MMKPDEIRITVSRIPLSDGSIVHDVAVRGRGAGVILPAVSENDAEALVEALRAAITKHTNERVWT